MLLMLDLVLPHWAAVGLGAVIALLLLTLWAVLPLLRRRSMQQL